MNYVLCTSILMALKTMLCMTKNGLPYGVSPIRGSFQPSKIGKEI